LLHWGVIEAGIFLWRRLAGRIYNIMMTTEQIIDFFGMKPLEDEGGFYIETYRAKEKFEKASLPDRYSGDRNYSTQILYLLPAGQYSRLHRVKSDEVFHFYMGDAVTMLQLFLDGGSKVINLGHDIYAGQQLQVVVPQGTWQGCLLNDGGKFALMGCTVSPGFEFEDYQSGDRDKLLAQYQNQQDLIIKLTDKK